MITVKKLSVSVTYKVGLGNVEMPEDVKEQLIQAAENCDEIEMNGMQEYPEAFEWLSNNVREADCFSWVAEIENVE